MCLNICKILKFNQFANQLNLCMQENSVVQIPTPKTAFQSVLSTCTEHETIFQKYKDISSLQFSAFKLVKSSSDNQNSDSENQGSSNDWFGKRRKRGCYRKYTLEQKQEAVRKIMNGNDVKQISRQYGIPRRNLLRWKKNGCQRKQGGGRPTDSELQTMLYSKILNKDIKSEKQIRQQAKKLSKCQNFKASKGWYCKFNKRFTNWNQKTGIPREIVQWQNNENGQYQNK